MGILENLEDELGELIEIKEPEILFFTNDLDSKINSFYEGETLTIASPRYYFYITYYTTSRVWLQINERVEDRFHPIKTMCVATENASTEILLMVEQSILIWKKIK